MRFLPRLIPLVLFAAVASLHCSRAGGVAEDPIHREAEDALVEYLRIDTTNPPGNETAGATFLRDVLAREKIAARLIGPDPKRQAVYARLESPSDEKALLLLSHIDVVPADWREWRNPPFEGKREGGYIWGRGAIDAKSLTIAHMMALVDLKRRGAALRRDVIFLAVPDEELGGLNGTRKLLDAHPELFADVGLVLNEGGANETAVDRVLVWGVEVQQKVPLWLRVTTRGNAGHGASGADGGAPMKLVRAIAAIDAIERPYRLTDSVARAAAASLAVRKDSRGRRLALLREPLDVPRLERELSPSLLALVRDTIAVTRLSAGSAVNVVPTTASAEIDIRLLPGTKPDEMLARVKAAAGDDAAIEVLLSGEPVPESPASGEAWQSVAGVMVKAAPGSVVVPIVSAGTTDSRFFRARGAVAYGISPFKLNFYDADGVHGNDERIRARFFAEGVTVMRQIVRALCENR